MKNEIISFETAKLAKEKGVNFTSDGKVYNDIGLLCDNGFHNLDEIDIEYDIPAPTQSLLQRWLREVHNIFLTVEYSLSNDNWFYYLYKQEFNKYIHFKIYEKALEAGLLEALKLIK